MKKINVVIVGNCQARPIAKLVQDLNPAIEVTAIAIVHLLKTEQFNEYKLFFEQADLIISQLVADSYPCQFVQTNYLKERYGSKVISIVNLYFSGYTPDWFYIRIPGHGPLRGPMGDYHNKTIFEAWQSGQNVQIAAERLDDKIYNKKYIKEIDLSLSNLKKREQKVDVFISDYIEKNYKKKRLFYTFNHPTMSLLRTYCKRILTKAGLQTKRSWLIFIKNREMLNQFVPRVNPAMGLLNDSKQLKHIGVKFSISTDTLVSIGRAKEYSSLEIAESYYQIYELLGDKLQLKQYGTTQA